MGMKTVIALFNSVCFTLSGFMLHLYASFHVLKGLYKYYITDHMYMHFWSPPYRLSIYHTNDYCMTLKILLSQNLRLTRLSIFSGNAHLQVYLGFRLHSEGGSFIN